MGYIRDYDGNNLGAADKWQYLGHTDINGKGLQEYIFVNPQIGRWASVAIASDGNVYMDNFGSGGNTRVVGIYTDPLVANGSVQKGGPFDSQTRFQNDLYNNNIGTILGSGDYDHNGLQEVYFKLKDGSAFLHAYMWADGNIQYANYQNATQVQQYLTSNGYSSSYWGTWF
jgi:hypothetical protein